MEVSADMAVDSLQVTSANNEESTDNLEAVNNLCNEVTTPVASLEVTTGDNVEEMDVTKVVITDDLQVIDVNNDMTTNNLPAVQVSNESTSDNMPATGLDGVSTADNVQEMDVSKDEIATDFQIIEDDNIGTTDNVQSINVSEEAPTNGLPITEPGNEVQADNVQPLVSYSIQAMNEPTETSTGSMEATDDTNKESIDNLQVMDITKEVMAGNLQIVDLTNEISEENQESTDLSNSMTADNLQALASQVMAGNLQIVNITQDGSENNEMPDLSSVVLPDNIKVLASQVMAGNLQIIDFNEVSKKMNTEPDHCCSTNLQIIAQEILAGNLQIVDLTDDTTGGEQTSNEKISNTLQALGSTNGNLQIVDIGNEVSTSKLQTADAVSEVSNHKSIDAAATGDQINVTQSNIDSNQSPLCGNKMDGIHPSTEPSMNVTMETQIINPDISDVITVDQVCVEKSPLSIINVPINTENQIDLQPVMGIPGENQIVFSKSSSNVKVENQNVFTEARIDDATEKQIVYAPASMGVSSSSQIVFSQPSINVGSGTHPQTSMDATAGMQIVIGQQDHITDTQASIVVGDDNQISISQSSLDASAGNHHTIHPHSIDVASSEMPLQQVEGVQMQPVNGVGQSEAETITINLPKSTIQNLQLNGGLALSDSPVTVLQTDYMNILDIVLNNSKLTIQGDGIDGSQPLVLAEVDRDSGEMVAVKGPDGNHITLTPQQMSAINVAAATGSGDLSIVTSDGRADLLNIKSGVSNPEKNSLMTAAMSGIKQETSTITMKDDNGDEIEFEDDIDDDHFEIASSPSPEGNGLKPLINNTDGKTDVKYKCNECGRPYLTKAALRKHLLVVHDNKEMEISVQKATSKCIHPGCEKIFYHRQKMIDHLKEEHGVNCVQEDLVFNSWDEFFIWKEKEEDANFVHFSKNSTHTNAANYMLTNFTCQREGKAGYKYKGSQQKKYKDLVIGEKICPARMRARLDKPTGRVTVQYCKSHNHKLSFQDFLYRRMPDRLRNEIREKLVSGMSSEEIYKELKSTDNLRETRGERFAPSKRQFVTLVNIKTIAKRMQIKESGPSKQFVLDPDPYAIQIQKLLDESYNPVLLYKDQGVTIEVGPAEIEKLVPNGLESLLLIGIQTKEQKDMFVKHGHKLVFIDITEAIVAPTQYIITVKVLDEYNKGYPVAFLLSNSRDETVLFYFFREIQTRVAESELKINAVMTENSCNEYYAFRSVFGEHVKHLLCKWNLHRAWCQKIHEECAGDEALQQELYFIFVTMLEEQDLSKFESIATEFVNNYQARCANFIQFFMSNYLSQPEVWASCYRNNPYSDCDEILYGDRLHERIKKEIKNNQQVRSVDDLLDLTLKFEHEDYFNRGLNLMLNPPEGDLILSEHALGLKIKNSTVTENYTADNRWLVKTSKRDPSDLQNIKEESYIVTWKADICEKDFCRERCLKLTCFGLCGHLYHCSCDVTTVTPCSHIHKVHSLRIGVTQYQNEEKEMREAEDLPPVETIKTVPGPHENLIVSITEEKKDDGKLNLINQATSAGTLEQDNRTREEKIRKIKLDLVKMYKFLESENIKKYSLDFIDAGLKKVIDECKIIDSIGQNKSLDSFAQGKRKSPDEDLQDFELLVKHTKRRKVMGNSVPVIVEIEPNPATYNTFRKRITGSTDETPEDRMLKLSRSKSITVNIESDDKFRKNTNQQVTSTPGIIVAKEDNSALKDEIEELPVAEQNHSDTEWTPKGQRKGKNKSSKIGQKRRRSRISKPGDTKISHLDRIPDPLKDIIQNGNTFLNMTHIKTLDSNISQAEIDKCKAFVPGWDVTNIPEVVIDSFFYTLSQKYNVLSLTVEQMSSLCNNQPHITRFWEPEDITGDKCCSYIFVPWKSPNNYYSLFVIDLMNHCITYLDSSNGTPQNTNEVNILHNVNRAHTTLVGLMITEIPFDSTRVKQLTWPLTVETDIELDNKDHTIRSLWYAHQLCNNTSLSDNSVNMSNFRKELYDSIVGKCLEHVIEDNTTFCPVCNFDGNTAIECSRCNQMYHSSCLRGIDIDSFVCSV